MSKIIKYTFFICLAIIAFTVLFFLWASSPNLKPENYSKITITNIEPSVNNDSIYSIVSYNVGYLSGMTNNRAIEKPKSLFAGNLKKIKQEFKQINADIIAIQEVDFDSNRSYNINQHEEIANLGYPYRAEAVNWDLRHVPYPYWPPTVHFGKVVSGQSVISKYPVKSHNRITLERVKEMPYYKNAFYLERLAQVVKVIIDGVEVIIINVHLEAFDKKTRTNQMKEVINLYKNYYKTYPTFLLGDFNSDPDYNDASIYLAFDLPETGCAAYSADNYVNTFSTRNPYERLDYIFYNKRFIEYIDGKVLESFGEASDHFPVVMRFKFLSEKKPSL